jgi:hypothetical protein
MVKASCVFWFGLLLSSPLAFGQDGFTSKWLDMVTQTENEQPHWIIPLATTTPTLHQLFRYDIQWQTQNSGVTTTNCGVGKGLSIVPEKNVEVILAVPPYIVNNPASPNDGFGDWQVLVKYRISRSKRGTWKLHFDRVLPDELPHRTVPTGCVESDHHARDCLRKGLQRFLCAGNIRGQFAYREYSNHWTNDLVEQCTAIPRPKENLAGDRV